MASDEISKYGEELQKIKPFTEKVSAEIEMLIPEVSSGQQERLQRIFDALKKQDVNLSKLSFAVDELRRICSEQVDQYIDANRPFSYDDEDFEASYSDRAVENKLILEEKVTYWKLIKYSMMAQDFGILDRWAINYPFNEENDVETMMDRELTKKYLKGLFKSQDFMQLFGDRVVPYLSYLVQTL